MKFLLLSILVAYFSATGTTQKVAERIALEQHATLWEIEPMDRYTHADLNWHNKQSRSSLEMADPHARPSIKDCTNIQPYDTICLGFPIWWGTCPRIINSWLDNNVELLLGKTIMPFATSGSSSIDGAVRDLRSQYPTLHFTDGKRYSK